MNPTSSIRWPSAQQPKVTMAFTAWVSSASASLGHTYSPPPAITRKSIIADVARRRRLSVEDLTGPGRWRDLAWARQEAMWLMKRTGKWSLSQIGGALGGRDHSTVIFGIRRHAERNGLPE